MNFSAMNIKDTLEESVISKTNKTDSGYKRTRSKQRDFRNIFIDNIMKKTNTCKIIKTITLIVRISKKETGTVQVGILR